MACEACAIKFTLFKRKKQCMDCLQYFCTECVIRRFDRILSCDNCSMLARRPVIKSQIYRMSTKYLRQYLLAKKVSVRGCIEKEDLVNLLIIFANGNDVRSNERVQPVPEYYVHENRTISNETPIHYPRSPEVPEVSEAPQAPEISEVSEASQADEMSLNTEDTPNHQHQTPQIHATGEVSSPVEDEEVPINIVVHNVEIEEVFESDDNVNGESEPEPLITEQEEVPEIPHIEHTDMFKELQTWNGRVKLSDISKLPELENLSVKQLKDLLSANRVDFKGCVERCELLDRACRLWEEYQKSRKDVESADEDALCKICLDAPIECVILECGHMACCINCGKQMSECPICRQYVIRVVRFFKA